MKGILAAAIMALALAAPTYPQGDPALVGYWSFEEGSGDITNDQSGNGNTGYLRNGPAWVSGKFGMALEFDGIDDYVEIYDAASLDITGEGITFMAWVYSPGFLYAGWVVGKGEDPHDDLVWGIHPLTDGRVRYWIKSDGTRLEQTPATPYLQTDIWQHIAVTYDGSQMKFYHNGVVKDSVEKTGILDINDDPVFIGLDGWAQGNHYRGKIDEVKVFARALAPCEIVLELTEVFSNVAGDANGDCDCNVGDAVYLINFVFKGGPPPVDIETIISTCGGNK